MTNFLAAVHALAWLLTGIAAIFLLAEVAVRTLIWREERERRHDAEDAAAYPLPAPDAPDEVFDDWHRAVVGLHPHRFATTARQIAALPTTQEIA